MITQILIIFILTLLVIGLLVIGIQLRSHRAGGRRPDRRAGYSEVLVRDAVNVHTQKYGSGAGDYFNVGDDFNATILSNGQRIIRWHASFLNQGTGEQYRISFSDRMSIGRRSPEGAGEGKLVLREDRMISKTHCVIYANASGLVIEDAGSHNHTYLNGRRLREPAWLHQGDELTLGNTKLKVRFVQE